MEDEREDNEKNRIKQEVDSGRNDRRKMIGTRAKKEGEEGEDARYYCRQLNQSANPCWLRRRLGT